VIADTPLTAIRIERTAFRHLLREEPDLALKVLEGMARRTRKILDAPPL
jgi:CRP-like cAMP-binding protein